MNGIRVLVNMGQVLWIQCIINDIMIDSNLFGLVAFFGGFMLLGLSTWHAWRSFGRSEEDWNESMVFMLSGLSILGGWIVLVGPINFLEGGVIVIVFAVVIGSWLYSRALPRLYSYMDGIETTE